MSLLPAFRGDIATEGCRVLRFKNTSEFNNLTLKQDVINDPRQIGIIIAAGI
jgi:hypothetical protein